MDRVSKIIIKYFESRGLSIKTETSIFDEELIDSIELIELMSFLEDHFKVEFPPSMYNKSSFSTIKNISKNIALLKSSTLSDFDVS